MHKTRAIVLTLIAALPLLFAESPRAESGRGIPVYAGDFPPYVSEGGNGPEGLMVELLAAIGERAGLAFELHVVPWARAQHIVAEQGRPAMIIPLTRTPAREPDYDWVVPLLEDPLAMITLEPATTSVRIGEFADKGVGVQVESPNEAMLRELGFTDLYAFNDESTAARMLQVGRIEAWFARPMVARSVYAELGGDPETLTVGPEVPTPAMFLGATKGAFSTEVLDSIRGAYEALETEGQYAELLANY